MREANWDEIFQRPATPAEVVREPGFLPWEDWLTFGILTVMFLSVVHSIDSANWVDDMPSLYPIGFAGLIMGYGLSRLRWNELLIHPPALLTGAALVYLQLISIVPGGSVWVRTNELIDRMRVWWTAVTEDGISTDPLPFIVLMLALVWLGAYVSSWAVFRWRNAWLALVPGGIALMWNISFIPGQYSNSFVVFVFAAVLLLMRVHLAHKEAEWDRDGVKYPEFISLPVLNATFWVAVALLLLASWMPLAERSETASERWSNFTAPLTERFTPLGRVFISVNAKKPISVHNLEDALPLQGKIKLNGREAVDIDVEITPEMAAYLRGQSFDEYTSSGWKVNIEADVPIAAGERPDPAQTDTEDGARKVVTINVTVKGNNDDTVYSLGQPLETDVGSQARVGANGDDVTGLQPDGRLHDGDRYAATGSVAIASIEQLQAAGTDYPAWVEERYLDLPGSVPDRVYRKAAEVTRGADTPFEAAVAIERYLRTFPNDFDVSSTPPGRDSVDYFLFDLQRGYFDYHASAMAVMLRSLGVPARVATGYAIDPLAREGPDSNVYKLTERNAFAWPEVYFPGVGWVEFSPTPSQPLIRRPGVSEAAPAEGGTRGLEDPNAVGGDELGFGQLDEGQQPAAGDEAFANDGGGSRSWPVMLTLIVLGAVVATAALGARFAWEFGLAGLPRPVQLWEKTQRLARIARAGAKLSDTPREFASRLRNDVPGTNAATYMAAQYERSRFGRKDLSEEETEHLETAWSTVRNQLLRRIFRPKRSG